MTNYDDIHKMPQVRSTAKQITATSHMKTRTHREISQNVAITDIKTNAGLQH